ncbi:MAG: ABC transporter, partial [Nitrosomonadales bacterium]|nr:ABC transporter [Nitrosomonadales bacterium]
MKANKKLRFQYSLQNSFFLILFLSLVFVIGVIANQFAYVKDMTQANRSVLTQGSIEVVESMK